jgi:hypothetical protein
LEPPPYDRYGKGWQLHEGHWDHEDLGHDGHHDDHLRTLKGANWGPTASWRGAASNSIKLDNSEGESLGSKVSEYLFLLFPFL